MEQGVVAMEPGTLDPEPVMSWDLLPALSPNLSGSNVTPCMERAPPKSALTTDATPSRTTCHSVQMLWVHQTRKPRVQKANCCGVLLICLR